jgi:hypothetical protein
MLVRNEITEKIKKINATMIRLDFIMFLFTVTCFSVEDCRTLLNVRRV